MDPNTMTEAQLRLKSARNFLPKEVEKQRILLEREIADEEKFFIQTGENLTKEERERLANKKRILEFITRLAESTKDEKEKARGEEPEEEEDTISKYEKVQFDKLKLGDELVQRGEPSKKYEYVFEDQMAFIKEEIDKGHHPEAELEIDPENPETFSDQEEDLESAYEQIQRLRKTLPIYTYKQELLDAIKENQILILVGETGSGKTTQIPQYLHEAGYCSPREGDEKHLSQLIGCTQPRRVAAMSVASRVAVEMNAKLGRKVGYSIRFEDNTCDKTQVKYMTDGMLLREMLGNPQLEHYSVMIIDEAHERTIHTDILFGLLKDVCKFRKDLKLIISSATLDAEKFSEFYGGAPIFFVPGRKFKVDIFYSAIPVQDYIATVVQTVFRIHMGKKKGDILVFLTGQEGIEKCAELLEREIINAGNRIQELIVRKIYANLPAGEQTKIFLPTPERARKVVLATNIAETSLTIDGIVFVIDPGYCKQKSFNPHTGLESLLITPISKAAARQRSGRAGRVSSGRCYRLYTKDTFEKEMDENNVPEIQRSNLSSVVLMLKGLGIHDLVHFDFLDPPPSQTLINALKLLYSINALNYKGELTTLGLRMAEFPIDPMLAKALIYSEKYKCVDQLLTIASMLSCGQSVFFLPAERDEQKRLQAITAHKGFQDKAGDHITLLKIYEDWNTADFKREFCRFNFFQPRALQRAFDIREQLENLLERVEIELTSNSDPVNICKAITSGFVYNIAVQNTIGIYKTMKTKQIVNIHPQSVWFHREPPWICYHELVLTTKKYMRNCIAVEKEWLPEVAPHIYSKKEVNKMGKVKPKVRQRKYRSANRLL